MSVLLKIYDFRFGTEKPHDLKALVTPANQQRTDMAMPSSDSLYRARPAQ
jgi:hypothetical protein